MKTRKTVSIILAVLPIALALTGLFGTLVWPLNAVETEGWSFVIFITIVLPIVAIAAIPLSVSALILSRKGGLLFVKILAIINLVWAVPIAVYGIILWL